MRKKIFIVLTLLYAAVFGWFVQVRLDKSGAEQRIATDFVFPVLTTKAELGEGSSYNNQTLVWDSMAPKSYHHDYPAADIHVSEGTKVSAAKGGQVVMVRNTVQCDKQNFPLIVIRGVDGYYYLYSHLKPNSISLASGDLVETGGVLAEVGSSTCAQNTAPHLHFDVSRFKNAARGGFWGQVTLIDPQPALIKAYQKLPEK